MIPPRRRPCFFRARSCPLLFWLAGMLVAGAGAQGAVLIQLAGGLLKGTGATPLPVHSGLLVLVASTGDNQFAPPQAGSSLLVGAALNPGGDEVVLARASVEGDGNHSGGAEAGEFRHAFNFAYPPGVAAGQAVGVYWFPQLSASSTTVEAHAAYGFYRGAAVTSPDADGSAPWVLPEDGGFTTELLFVSPEAGSVVNTTPTRAGSGQAAARVSNHAPVAFPDSLRLGVTGPLSLRENDTDEDGDPLTITAVGTASFGTVSLSEGVVTYSPGANYAGRDSFTYTVSDGFGGSAVGTVTLANTLPVANGDSFPILGKTSLPVLANDRDPDGDGLTLLRVSTPKAGTAVITGTSILYTPEKAFSGLDQFTYTISDGFGGTATASVIVSNALLAGRGTYLAAFSSAAVTGSLTATLASGGAVTGKITLHGKAYAFKSVANAQGRASAVLAALGLSLTLDFTTNAAGQALLSGSIKAGAATVPIEATPVYATAEQAGVRVGRYNVALPGAAPETPKLPQGTGWLSMVIAKTGAIAASGRLPDNTPFTFGALLRADGSALAASAPYGTGSFSGRFLYASLPGTEVSGSYALMKPVPVRPGGLFLGGFTLQNAVRGSFFSPPAATAPLFARLNAAKPVVTLQTEATTVTPAVNQSLAFPVNGKVTPLPPVTVPVTLAVARATGLVTGSFTPVGGKKILFTGALLPGENLAVGLYGDTVQTAELTVGPGGL